MPGLKELGSVLGCAMAVGLLVVAGDFSDYSGFGRVELAQAQVCSPQNFHCPHGEPRCATLGRNKFLWGRKIPRSR